jgi:hypothetical protein
MNKWVALGISAVVDFVITAGTAYTALGGTTLPNTYQVSVVCVGGLIAAARGVQGRLAPPPP